MKAINHLQDNQQFKLFAQFIALNIYLYLLIYEFHAGRFMSHYLALMSFTLLFDNIAYFLFVKRLRLRFLSPMITGTAIFILLNTHLTLTPYLIAASVGILGKYLFRYSNGHVFNPACLGILFVIFLMPQSSQALLKQWTSGVPHYILAYGVGLFVAALASRHYISIAYFATLATLSFVYGTLFSSTPSLNIVGPIFGFSIIVFAFHMITDPATSPKNPVQQMSMGGAIAILDFILRRMEQPYAPFIALMLVSSLRPIVANYWVTKAPLK